MGMCVLNRAGPGRQSDKPQMHRTLDWTALPSLPFLHIAKLPSKTSYLESPQVQRITWPPTTTAQEHYVQWNSSDCDGVAVRKGLQRSWGLEKFTARFDWHSRPFQLFIHNLFGFACPWFHRSTVNPHTHFTTWPPNVKKKGVFTVRHLAPISKSYKDRIRTSKKKKKKNWTHGCYMYSMHKTHALKPQAS